MDVGDALRGHVEDRLNAVTDKYFANAIDAHVVFSREGAGFRADCSIHVGHGIEAQSRADTPDVYASFDSAANRVEKQLRRYKRRLRDHQHRRTASMENALQAQNYVLEREPEHEEVPEEFQPVIVAEHTADVHDMSVGDAVMQLELGEHPVVIFRNSKHGQLNVVFRRSDGHIGWLDLADSMA